MSELQKISVSFFLLPRRSHQCPRYQSTLGRQHGDSHWRNEDSELVERIIRYEAEEGVVSLVEWNFCVFFAGI